jgi:hypothetical protein
MTDDARQLSDFAHALRMELRDAWQAGGSALTAGDPDAVAEFKAEFNELLIAATRDPLAVLARHEAAVAAIKVPVAGRAVTASNVAAPQRDLHTIVTEVYASRAATVREAVATGGADVPDASVADIGHGGLPDAADIYRRRAAAAGGA